MIWNESIECMDRESLRKIQSIRLKKTVERVYHDTPFYRKPKIRKQSQWQSQLQ